MLLYLLIGFVFAGFIRWAVGPQPIGNILVNLFFWPLAALLVIVLILSEGFTKEI